MTYCSEHKAIVHIIGFWWEAPYFGWQLIECFNRLDAFLHVATHAQTPMCQQALYYAKPTLGALRKFHARW
ncbi:MAG: hypothetical protein IPN04_13010 [Rhodoferax sp.]|nr:hypothetical protein [Rhodoferax sp.]